MCVCVSLSLCVRERERRADPFGRIPPLIPAWRVCGGGDEREREKERERDRERALSLRQPAAWRASFSLSLWEREREAGRPVRAEPTIHTCVACVCGGGRERARKRERERDRERASETTCSVASLSLSLYLSLCGREREAGRPALVEPTIYT